MSRPQQSNRAPSAALAVSLLGHNPFARDDPQNGTWEQVLQHVINDCGTLLSNAGVPPTDLTKLAAWILDLYPKAFDVCARHLMNLISGYSTLSAYWGYLSLTQSRTLRAAQAHLPLSKLPAAHLVDAPNPRPGRSAGYELDLPAVKLQKDVISSLRTHLSIQFSQWEQIAEREVKRAKDLGIEGGQSPKQRS